MGKFGVKYNRKPRPWTLARIKENSLEDHVTGCWIWKMSGRVYGKLGINGKWHSAHRTSWRLANGDVPPGMFILHRCDRPRCVNPDHLFAGTQRENIRDMDAKGRRPPPPMKGEKLAAGRVLELLPRLGTASIRALAKEFGVSSSLISLIALGRRWGHVTGIPRAAGSTPRRA